MSITKRGKSDFDVIRATEQSQTSFLPRLSQPLSASDVSDRTSNVTNPYQMRLDSQDSKYYLQRNRNLSRTTGLIDYLTEDKSSEARKYSEIHNQDIQLLEANEKRKAVRKAAFRRIRMQLLIFFLAALRFYFLGILELSSQINLITGSQTSTTVATSVLSFLIFGQIIDNLPISKQKSLFCSLEIGIAIWFIFISWIIFDESNNESTITKKQYLSTSFFLTSAFQISMTLQLFNWFGKGRLGTVLGLWLSTQCFGVMTKFRILEVWSFFPDFRAAENSDPQVVFKETAVLQLVIGCIFVLFSIFDWYFFVFHPLELGIVVDIDAKRDQDRFWLRKVEIDQQLNPGTRSSSTELLQSQELYRVQSTLAYQNSYVQVFQIYEFKRLLITSFLQQTASYLAAEVLPTQYAFSQNRSFFFYGSTLAFFTLGLYSDLLSKGKNHYTLLAVLITIEVLYLVVQILYCAITNQDHFVINYELSMTLFGYVLSIATVLQVQLIPLIIAGKYRDHNSPWELPLAGQMLSTAQFAVLWMPLIAAPLLQEGVLKYVSYFWKRTLIVIMLLLSLAFLYRLLRFEAKRRNYRAPSNEQLSSSFSHLEKKMVNSSADADTLVGDFNLEVEKET